jgi:serine/threonine protein phosphatase 1
MTIYAIGDIHGQLAMLEDALARIEADGAGPEDEVIFLGDYTDRGPHSKGVIELLSRGLAEGRNWTCLMGNHDRMFRNYLADGTVHDPNVTSGIPWPHRRMGGKTTMESYGVDPSDDRDPAQVFADTRDAVPDSHRAFLDGLVLTAERGPLLFVHAGIRPGIPLAEQREDDLVWIRGDFHAHADPHPWLVVHGHTALDEAQHFGNRIDLDSGAGYDRPLTAVVFEGMDCLVLEGTGRSRLVP